MDELIRLASLIKQSNAIANEMAAIIQRPAQIGHLGEYIASRIYGIELAHSATQKGIDGYFLAPPLARSSVNVKWYGKGEGLLDITPLALPDYYLVMTGPRAASASSRGMTRPLVIEYVFLFDAVALVNELQARSVRIGVATSVIQRLWLAAEIFPTERNPMLMLSNEQRYLLSLFGSQ